MKTYKDSMKMHNQIFEKMKIVITCKFKVPQRKKKVLEYSHFLFSLKHFCQLFIYHRDLYLKLFCLGDHPLQTKSSPFIGNFFSVSSQSYKDAELFFLSWLVCHWNIVCFSDFCAFALQLLNKLNFSQFFCARFTSDDRSFY